MKNKFQQDLPCGLAMLRIFYILNAFLFIITSLIYFEYIDIIILGKTLPTSPAVAIRVVLITLSTYLFFGISYLRRETYPLAITYHLFFITNGIITIPYLMNNNLKLKPLLEIGIKPEYKVERIVDLFGASWHLYAIQILSILIGLITIIYFFKKRGLFTG